MFTYILLKRKPKKFKHKSNNFLGFHSKFYEKWLSIIFYQCPLYIGLQFAGNNICVVLLG